MSHYHYAGTYRTIRKILPAELPTVTDIDPTKPRAATVQELANMGIVPLGNDFYSCTHQEETKDWETFRVKDIQHPGVEVTRGQWRKERWDALSPANKNAMLRALVIRGKSGPLKSRLIAAAQARGITLDAAGLLAAARAQLPGDNANAFQLRVPVAQIDPNDVVVSTNDFPHHWQGEPNR